jgi:hypothetical protein
MGLASLDGRGQARHECRAREEHMSELGGNMDYVRRVQKAG